MPPKEGFNWKAWGLGIAGSLIVALIVGLGSTAWSLYNRVMVLEGDLKASNLVNEAQQREIDRLWDSVTSHWADTSEAVATIESDPTERSR